MCDKELIESTTVPTLFEQNQLVGIVGQICILHGECKQLIERSFRKHSGIPVLAGDGVMA